MKKIRETLNTYSASVHLTFAHHKVARSTLILQTPLFSNLALYAGDRVTAWVSSLGIQDLGVLRK